MVRGAEKLMAVRDIALLVVAFLLSAGITGVVKVYAHRVSLLDIPNQRSSHGTATPRGGGLGIVIVFLGAVLAFWAFGDLRSETAIALIAGGGLIAGIGFIDDHRDVAAGWRLLVQLIAATLAIVMLGGMPVFQLGSAFIDLGAAGDVLAIVFMVWFTNAFNFMDGIDGIAAVEAICIAAGALVIASPDSGVAFLLLLGILAAASLGFLVWNWPPAKIFLGDIGSAFLGFVLIAVAIQGSGAGSIAVWSWLILAGVFIVDATTTLLVRMLRREKWLLAHRDHAYQIASRLFGSHRRVTLAVAAINLLWLFPLAFAASRSPAHGWWLTMIAWAPLIWVTLTLGAGRADDRPAAM
jgi:Fuc2NAc and GlcNAc transferase